MGEKGGREGMRRCVGLGYTWLRGEVHNKSGGRWERGTSGVQLGGWLRGRA